MEIVGTNQDLENRKAFARLVELAAVYEAAPAACKGSLGLSLRKIFADVQAKRLEYRTRKVG